MTPVQPRKLCRDKVWTQIRTLGRFSLIELADASKTHQDTVRSFVKCLIAAGIVELQNSAPKTKKVFALVADKDPGPETPRLRLDGTMVDRGVAQTQMWRTMRAMREFTIRDLALQASTEEHPVSVEYSKLYVSLLAKAGYLHGEPAQTGRHYVYAFNPARNTGPRPPRILRLGRVYDANTDSVVWDGEEEDL